MNVYGCRCKNKSPSGGNKVSAPSAVDDASPTQSVGAFGASAQGAKPQKTVTGGSKAVVGGKKTAIGSNTKAVLGGKKTVIGNDKAVIGGNKGQLW